MTPRPRLKLNPLVSIAVAFLSFFFRPAQAATPSLGGTIDEEAAQAGVVVIGRVKSISPTSSPSTPWRSIKISVLEVLKGSPSPEIFVHAGFPKGDPAWLNSPKSVFFIQTGSRSARWQPANGGFSWVLDQSNGNGAIDLSLPASHGISSSALQNGLPPDRLVALIRAHCRFGVVNRFEMVVGPLGYADGWPALLELPLDPATDETARIWARSPDATTRWNAARLLRHTNSSGNIAALQFVAAYPPDSSKARLAQALAADQLRRWAIPPPAVAAVPRPSVRHAIILPILAIAIAAFYFFARRHWGAGLPALALCRRTAGVTLLTTLAVFCISSFFEGFGFENGNCEIAVWRGKLFLIRRSHLEISTADPGRFVDAADLWAVRDYFRLRYDAGHLPWQFAGGMQSWGQEVEPYWTTLWGFAIPIWEILAGLATVVMALRSVAMVQRYLCNGRPGFAVIGPSASGPPLQTGIVPADDAAV